MRRTRFGGGATVVRVLAMLQRAGASAGGSTHFAFQESEKPPPPFGESRSHLQTCQQETRGNPGLGNLRGPTGNSAYRILFLGEKLLPILDKTDDHYDHRSDHAE